MPGSFSLSNFGLSQGRRAFSRLALHSGNQLPYGCGGQQVGSKHLNSPVDSCQRRGIVTCYRYASEITNHYHISMYKRDPSNSLAPVLPLKEFRKQHTPLHIFKLPSEHFGHKFNSYSGYNFWHSVYLL